MNPEPPERATTDAPVSRQQLAGPFSGSRSRWLAAAAMAVVVVVLSLLVPRLEDIGVTWDEPWYFDSAHRIQAWFAQVVEGPERAAALQRETIEEVWGWARYYNPHPPAYKIAMAASEALVGRWLGPVTGFRTASALWFSLLLAAVGWVAARRWGLFSGAAAVLALLFMPRIVGHAHVAATDMPLALFWFCGSVGLAAFLRRPSFQAGALGAVGFGLGMATKFTGYLLPVPILLWALADRTARSRLASALVPIAAAVAVAYLVNPLAWHDPTGYLMGLFRESLGREESVPIATYYLGVRHLFSAPWHYAPVMSLATVPLSLAVLAVWGAVASVGESRRDWLCSLCLIQLGFFWALLALPGSPTHDGIRLFLPAFPFIALLAGRGLGRMWKITRRRVPAARRTLAAILLGLIFFFPPFFQTLQARPYYLSYYSELIGGAGGAEVRGMEATYWYDALIPAFLGEVNRLLPDGASLATYPSQDYFHYLQGLGWLRGDIEIRDFLPADYLLLYARKAMFSDYHWFLYNNVQPVRAVTNEGVELIGLYVWRDPADENGSDSADQREAGER